ncbi:MAG: hypothetical protein K0R15_998 [Clostridiales bacterium]|jgi:hypothetical protein|nr:hypothetical protein [Clostridiales bacterium]
MKATNNNNDLDKSIKEKEKSSKDLYNIAKALIVYIRETEELTKKPIVNETREV